MNPTYPSYRDSAEPPGSDRRGLIWNPITLARMGDAGGGPLGADPTKHAIPKCMEMPGRPGPGPGCTTTAADVLNPSRALVVLPVPFKLPGGRLVRVQLGPAITQCHALGFQLVSYCSTSYRTPGRPTHYTWPRLLGPGPGRDWPCRGYVGPRQPLRVLVASQLLHRDCPAAVTRVRQTGWH